ncbi:MAG: cytochrome c oxidase subunit II [Pseudomonadota bacterium]
MKAVASVISAVGGYFMVSSAQAAQPKDWGLWHQEPASDMMASIEWFDLYTFWFITPITIFVLLLLLYVMVKFNAKSNPNPSKTSHNTTIEVVWTVAPIVILIAIAIPSFELLDNQFDPGEEPSLTVKATGQSWFWDFEYQDDSDISFSSNLIGSSYLAGSEEAAQEEREELGKTDLAEYPNLLSVDNELVVPVNETIRVLVTADPAGVIHGFGLPAFGLKMDAIPGRLNETWFKANKEGLYYGQCSELCGVNHAYMPIGIRVVSRDQFEEWQVNVQAAGLDQANQELIASIEDARKTNFALNATQE